MDRVTEALRDLDILDRGEGPWRRYADEMAELIGRLEKSLVHVAVLGQFKRGKSTLINALLGAQVLPSAILPLTSVPTLIHDGTEPGLTIYFKNGRTQKTEIEKVFEFVTEKGNPGNAQGVEKVELSYNAPLLARGIVIIDTPGIGSTFTYNTDVTMSFLPHCDVGLFVISPDPPITEVELEFLKAVAQRLTRLFFVLNKVDYLKAEERDEMVAFLESTIREKAFHKEQCEIFPVSALQGLQGRKAGLADVWEKSGMKVLEDHLTGFFNEAHEEVLCRAMKEKTDAIVEEARSALRLRIRALETPLEDLMKKINELSSLEAEVKEERLWIRDSLAAEQQRLAGEIWEKAEALKRQGMRKVDGEIRAVMGKQEKEARYEAIAAALRSCLDNEIPSFFRDEKEGFIQDACRLCENRLTLLMEKADELMLRVRNETMALFDLESPPPLREPFSFKWPEFFWEHIRYSSGLFEVGKRLLYHALPSHILRRVLVEEAMKEAEYLIVRNASKLRYSVLDGLERMIKRLNMKLIVELEQAFRDTRLAIQDSIALHREKSSALTPLINDLNEQENKMKTLCGNEVID